MDTFQLPKIVLRYGPHNVRYEGCHADLIASGILEAGRRVPAKPCGSVRWRDAEGQRYSVTMARNGMLRVSVPKYQAARTDEQFHRFMQAAIANPQAPDGKQPQQ